MAIRRIVVPLTGAEGDGPALAGAMRVAQAQKAHVDGVYLRPDPAEAVPYVGDAASAAVIEDIYQATKAAADSAAVHARQTLEAMAAGQGLPLIERPAPETMPSVRFLDFMGSLSKLSLRLARLADLAVCADVANNPSALAAFEAALIGARRPVLLVPKTLPAALGQKAVIAWNGSAEAANAVQAALPLLAQAASIVIIAGAPEQLDGPPADALQRYLALQGIAASIELLDSKVRPVAAALIEKCVDLDADLIVMGGFGHSRLREFILGGVTRYMLGHSPISVFMAH